MLNLVDSYSNEHQYQHTIHSTKSAIVRQNCNTKTNKKEALTKWTLGETNVTVSNRITHLVKEILMKGSNKY